MRKLTLVLSTAALSFSGAAIAQNAPAAREPMADITRAQAQARAEAAFDRRDANRDGAVDQADRQARRTAMFDRIDTNRDGSISRAEFEAQAAKRGERAGKRMAARRDMTAANQGPMTREAFVERALNRFDRMDANRDGTVTAAERQAARETMRGQWRARAAERQQG